MVVEWSARARTDMRELRAYIAQDSPHYARRFVEKIFKAVEMLSAHPQIGRKVPEADREVFESSSFRITASSTAPWPNRFTLSR